MKLVEKLPDIASLSSQSRSRALNYCGIQAQSSRDIDARRRSRHTHFQLISRLQGRLVKAHRRVDYSRRVCAINLERSVVRGNDRHAANAAKVSGNRDG